MSHTQIEVAQLMRSCHQEYLDKYHPCAVQRKAMEDLMACRTAALGGHVQQCNHCGDQRIAYNSCRNRHCNKCQYARQLVWIDKLQSRLPVCRYFHLVFTVPTALHGLMYGNPGKLYDVLFKSAAQALHTLCKDQKHLGAQTGMVAVLHTWGQRLTYHPHVHMLVPAGGLTEEQDEWIPARRKYLVPVKALSGVYRGKFCSHLKKLLASDQLKLPDDYRGWDDLKKRLYEKSWNVYAKSSSAGPQAVVKYLGNYTHKVAITNNRLLKRKDQKVSFGWKDYRKRAQRRVMQLTELEFIRRFMQHIVPSGFVRIRYYGFLSSVHKTTLELISQLIGRVRPPAILQGLSALQVIAIATGKHPLRCNHCNKGIYKPLVELTPP